MDRPRGGGFRDGRGRGGGGRGGRGGAGGGGGGGGQAGYNKDQERKPREAILDLAKFMDKAITVKFNGGREGISRPTS